MNLLLITNIYLLVCAVIGLLCGLHILFTQKAPMYFQLIVYAVCSIVFSRIYSVVTVACYDGLPQIFHIGFIGHATFMLFIFFANYGQIDFLVDDRKTLITKYRVIPIFIPAIELIISIVAFHSDSADLSVRISFCVLSVLAGFAGFLNMKHLIIPDVDNGIVKSIRGFNLLALLIEVCTLAEVGLTCFGLTDLTMPVQIILGPMYIAILPLLHREVKKWRQ